MTTPKIPLKSLEWLIRFTHAMADMNPDLLGKPVILCEKHKVMIHKNVCRECALEELKTSYDK